MNLRGSSAIPGSARYAIEGFSLVEVMVALIVLSVGLLGIARMQSLALSSTSVASKRSLAAIEGASLAAAMHENRGYWTSGDPAGATITIQGTTFSYTGAAALSGAVGQDCTSLAVPCTPAALAAYDLQNWSTALQTLLPSDTATISCGLVSPVSCTITISWVENAVAINAQQAAAETAAIASPALTAALQKPVYTLYVEP